MNQGLAVTGDFEILAGPGRAGASRPYFPLVARPVGPVKSVAKLGSHEVQERSRCGPEAVASVAVLGLVHVRVATTAHDGVRAAQIASSRAMLCGKR